MERLRAFQIRIRVVRILIVNRHIDQTAGGSETQCHEIATALAERGHEVVYAACGEGAVRSEHPYAIRPMHGRFHSAFRDALRDVRPDVVYWRFNKRHLLRSVLDARRAGARFVFAVSHINDLRPVAAKPFYGARLSAARRAARALGRARIAALGAVNHLALRLVDGIVYQHAGQIRADAKRRHVVIHNSARPARAVAEQRVAVGNGLTAAGGSRSQSRDAMPPRYVLWAGNLKKSKNPEDFVRLAADLEHTGVEFRMAGQIQDTAYRKLLEAESLPRNFRYLGHQSRDALDVLMSGCLLLVHTCDPEGFPNVFIQAWSAGKPVASLRFDPGEMLETYGIGVCAHGDYTSFKADVEQLMADEALRGEIGRRALAFVAEHCDRDKNVAKLEAFFGEVLAAPAR